MFDTLLAELREVEQDRRLVETTDYSAEGGNRSFRN